MTTTFNQEKNTQSYVKDWQKGYESQPNEYDYWIEEIEGEIPKNLQGTLLRNGSGLLDVNGIPIRHPFDGDGMICAFTFKDGRCHFRNRFVRTKGYLEEQKAGKILYRGFGTQKSGGWLANIFNLEFKNVANTNVIYWGDRIWAMWEGGQPYRLNPTNLDTIGLDNLDGNLASGQPFAAHPRKIKNQENNEEILVTFGVKQGISSQITVWELDNKGKLIQSYQHSIAGFAFLHDMLVTPNYCIFFHNPFIFDSLSFLLGIKSGDQCLKYRSDLPTKIIIIDRHNNHKMDIIETDSFFVFHHANAWEANEQIYLESVCYDSFPELDANIDFRTSEEILFPRAELRRFTINLKTQKVESKLIGNRGCEFPIINSNYTGLSYRYLYMNTSDYPNENAPLQAVMKTDWQTEETQVLSFGTYGFPSEPIFVPFPDAKNEDDGWLLVLVYDASIHRSYLSILDARDLTKQPIAKLNLKHHIPHGFHGNWTNKLIVNS
jgi:all-trans-8'-apo-beta-carotenal 15,15'-oxygenase